MNAQKLISKEWNYLKDTFIDFDHEYFFVMGFEFVYGILLYLFSNPMQALDMVTEADWNAIVWDQAQMLTQAGALDQNIALLEGLILKIFFVFILYFVFHSMLYSLFSYFSWRHIADKHFDLEHARGFVRISSMWIFMWMLIFAFMLVVFDVATWAFIFVLVFTLMLFLHTTTMMNIVLIHSKGNNTLRKVLPKVFVMSVHKLPKCFPPVTSGIVFIFVSAVLLQVIARFVPAISDHYLIEMYLFYTIAFITWWRHHLYNVLKGHAHTA